MTPLYRNACSYSIEPMSHIHHTIFHHFDTNYLPYIHGYDTQREGSCVSSWERVTNLLVAKSDSPERDILMHRVIGNLIFCFLSTPSHGLGSCGMISISCEPPPYFVDIEHEVRSTSRMMLVILYNIIGIQDVRESKQLNFTTTYSRTQSIQCIIYTLPSTITLTRTSFLIFMEMIVSVRGVVSHHGRG